MNLPARGSRVRLQADSLHAWIILSKEAPAEDCLMSFSLIRRLLVIPLVGLYLALHPDAQHYFRGWYFCSHLPEKGKGKVHNQKHNLWFEQGNTLPCIFHVFLEPKFHGLPMT